MRNRLVNIHLEFFIMKSRGLNVPRRMCEWSEAKRIDELTFSELLLEIWIAAAFLIEVKAIADENSGDADGYAYCSFGHHGTNVYKFQYNTD